MNPQKADELLFSITPQETDRYVNYWGNLQPSSPNDVFNRWLFSFLSVHTTWQANVRSFLKLKDRAWKDDKAELQRIIIDSKVGLTRIRTEGIWKFNQDFWSAPETWLKRKDESWVNYRDKLTNKCFGLGLTKTAFSCEMIYPIDCEVVCLDAHILKLFDFPYKNRGTPSYKEYRTMEEHWINQCQKLKLPSPIARSIIWDKLLKQSTMDYWSHVFH